MPSTIAIRAVRGHPVPSGRRLRHHRVPRREPRVPGQQPAQHINRARPSGKLSRRGQCHVPESIAAPGSRDHGRIVSCTLQVMGEPSETVTVPTVNPSVLKLGRWSRISAVLLGLAGLGAGGVAVFITNLEAGPVALISAGLIFVLIGMGGRIPNRLKVGESEAARDIAERSGGSERSKIIGALADLADRAPAVAAPGVKAIAYEEMVLSMLGALEDKSRTGKSKIPMFNMIKLKQAGRMELVDALLVSPEGFGQARRSHPARIHEGSGNRPATVKRTTTSRELTWDAGFRASLRHRHARRIRRRRRRCRSWRNRNVTRFAAARGPRVPGGYAACWAGGARLV